MSFTALHTCRFVAVITVHRFSTQDCQSTSCHLLRSCTLCSFSIYFSTVVYDFMHVTSYRSSVVTTLVLSCLVSDILELLYAESHFFQYPTGHPYSGVVKFRGVPFGVDTWCWGSAESKHLKLIGHEICSKNSNLCDHNTLTWRTDRRLGVAITCSAQHHVVQMPKCFMSINWVISILCQVYLVWCIQ